MYLKPQSAEATMATRKSTKKAQAKKLGRGKKLEKKVTLTVMNALDGVAGESKDAHYPTSLKPE
jgi:hypothetical protein